MMTIEELEKIKSDIFKQKEGLIGINLIIIGTLFSLYIIAGAFGGPAIFITS